MKRVGGRRLALAWLIGATCVVALAGWPAAAAGSAAEGGVVEWNARAGFYWATDAQGDARLRLVSEDRALLEAILAELRSLRLEAQHRLAWRLMAEVRAGVATKSQASLEGGSAVGVQVDGGTVAVVAAEHALEVLAAIEPELAARVTARLEAAARAQQARASHRTGGADTTPASARRAAAAEASGGLTMAVGGSIAGAEGWPDVFAGIDAQVAAHAAGESEPSGAAGGGAGLSLGLSAGSRQP